MQRVGWYLGGPGAREPGMSTRAESLPARVRCVAMYRCARGGLPRAYDHAHPGHSRWRCAETDIIPGMI